jgi:hypothetical protein
MGEGCEWVMNNWNELGILNLDCVKLVFWQKMQNVGYSLILSWSIRGRNMSFDFLDS